METAVIVKVAVSAAPYSIDKPYDYLVPQELLEQAVPGVRVTVPFGRGNRESEGMILARGSGEKIPGLKPVKALLDREPVLDQDGISLALWMRQRYFCTMFEAVKTILPAGPPHSPAYSGWEHNSSVCSLQDTALTYSLLPICLLGDKFNCLSAQRPLMISMRSLGLQCSAVMMAFNSSTAFSTVSLMTK